MSFEGVHLTKDYIKDIAVMYLITVLRLLKKKRWEKVPRAYPPQKYISKVAEKMEIEEAFFH